MFKIRWDFAWGIFITLVFLTLLTIRLEFFQKSPETVLIEQIPATQKTQDTWMNIYQNNKKIGVVHRLFTAGEKGFNFSETVFMQINTMGVTQVLNILTEGDLNPDMTISSFNFDLNSSLFRFQARGFVVKNKLILFVGLPDAQERSEIKLKDIPYMSGSIYEAAFRANLEKDASRSFSIFDPSTLGKRFIKVTRNADEVIPLMGKRILTQKYCADFMGAKNCAWLDKNGDVLKETSILGLSMEKVSPKKAQEGISASSTIDLTQIASVPFNVNITEPEKLNEIKIKISGISGTSLFLNGDRQSLHHDVLTITKEQLPAPQTSGNIPPEKIAVFLTPSPLIQSNHAQIKAQVEKIIKPTDTAVQKAKKIINWVYSHVEKKPVLSVPNALEVLKNKVGDCNEHAVLTTALLRAAGIPAQIEAGLVYQRGRFYYHAWNIIYLGQWITADAVFNQFPADVTHIRLVRGEGSEQLDLMGVIGKIKLEALEQEK
jgi:hypothetical protein